MSRISRPGVLACLAAFVPPAVVAFLQSRSDREFELPTLHVIAVTGTASLAAAVSVLLTLAALRRNDSGRVWSVSPSP